MKKKLLSTCIILSTWPNNTAHLIHLRLISAAAAAAANLIRLRMRRELSALSCLLSGICSFFNEQD